MYQDVKLSVSTMSSSTYHKLLIVGHWCPQRVAQSAKMRREIQHHLMKMQY